MQIISELVSLWIRTRSNDNDTEVFYTSLYSITIISIAQKFASSVKYMVYDCKKYHFQRHRCKGPHGTAELSVCCACEGPPVFLRSEQKKSL